MLPKVVLDEAIVEFTNKHYNAELDRSIIGRECFSHPHLQSHICNVFAVRPGEANCKFCNNVPGRVCSVTCHLSYICMAAFAYRLGIGGDDLLKALKSNFKMDFDKLYSEIQQAISGPPVLKDESNVERVVDQPIPEPKRKIRKKRGQIVREQVFDKDGNELLNTKAASLLYGCSYANMYSHIARGNLQKVVMGDKEYVRKDAVLKFKEKMENKKEKKMCEVDPNETKPVVEQKKTRKPRVKKDVVEQSQPETENNKEESTMTEEKTETPEKTRKPRSSKEKAIVEQNGETYFDITSAAKEYGCTYVNMYGLVKRGKISTHEINGLSYIKKSDVIAAKAHKRNTKAKEAKTE